MDAFSELLLYKLDFFREMTLSCAPRAEEIVTAEKLFVSQLQWLFGAISGDVARRLFGNEYGVTTRAREHLPKLGKTQL